MKSGEQVAREALSRMSALVHSRDLAFLDEFHPEFRLLVGSEEGEIASSGPEIEALLKAVYDLRIRISWVWDKVIATATGDGVIMFAEGHLVMTSDGRTEKKPYRMSGVLRQFETRWLWQLFHGAEPAPVNEVEANAPFTGARAAVST